MKKIFVFTLVLVLLAGTFTPAFAAGTKPVEPTLVVSSPETAYAGESFAVSFVAKNVGKTACLFNWRVVFPKSVVGDVTITAGAKMLQNQSNANNWVFSWKKGGFKPGMSIRVEFRITLKGDISGVQNLVTVVSSKGIKLGSRVINVLSPSLVWTISAPDSIVYGGRPFSIVLTVENPSLVDLPYDVMMEVFHTATDGSLKLYWVEGNSTSIKVFWQGTVPAGESKTFNFETASGKYLGANRLVELNDLTAGVQILSHDYQLVVGTGIPYGELKVTGVNAGPIEPGDMLAFESFYYGPVLGQFQVTRVDSSCPIQGLPLGSTSRYGITYYYTLHYVTLLPMEKPAGVTGPYTVTCNVTSTFNMLGDINTKYHGTGSFEVTIP